MRILITGGAGCLGSNLLEHWLPKGHEMLVIDNFATGKREVVPQTAGLQVIEGSIVDAVMVEREFARFRPQAVIHSAASYKDPANWREDAATNVIGSINVVRAAEACGAKRLVNFQTALCYGRPTKVPIPADHATNPFTSYGITKTAGEQFVFLAKIPAVSLRLANIAGPRLAIGPIPTFYKRLLAGQKCFCSDAVRDFLDMSDFFALMDVIISEGAATGTFNVSTGEGHSIKEIFDEVADFLGIIPSEPVPIVPVAADDVPEVVLDPSLTERMLGWKSKVGFRQTIRRQLDWYKLHGVSDVHSHLSAPKT